jgi:hypothetical protein
MVALVEQLGDRLPRYLAGVRRVRPDRRGASGEVRVLRGPNGQPLGTLVGVKQDPEFGPNAPTMYLRRGR